MESNHEFSAGVVCACIVVGLIVAGWAMLFN